MAPYPYDAAGCPVLTGLWRSGSIVQEFGWLIIMNHEPDIDIDNCFYCTTMLGDQNYYC